MRSPLGTLLNRAPVPYASRSGGWSMPLFERNDPVAQMEAMGSVGTLFSIVTVLANSTSQVNWGLWRKAASGKKEDRTEVPRHAALDLWGKPNPFMPRQEFVEVQQQHLELTGEAWWVVSRNPRAALPLELWPIRPDRMTPVPDPVEFIRGYIYTGPDGEKIPLEPADVIMLRMPNPLDPYRGMGPVQAVLADLDATKYSAQWNRNFFLNSAEPGGIIKVDRHLGDDEFLQLQERWGEQHRGVAAAHRVAVIEAGMDWVDRTITQRDMQFTELRTVSRDTIREAFGMPKFALGDVDDVNRATASASDAWFGAHLTVPRLERIKAALNSELLPLYGTAAAGLEFDYESPVTADAEAENAERQSKVDAFVALVTNGVDPASALEYLGLPGMEMAVAESTGSTPETLAELVQKLYLGVGPLITWEEGRQLLVDAGADLDLSLPPPSPPAPAAPPAAEQGGEQPAPEEQPPPPEPPPSRRAASASLGEIFRTAMLAAVDADQPREDWEDRLDQLIENWGPIAEAQRSELADQITRIVDEGTPAGLAELTVSSDDGAALLADAMFAQATAAAKRTADGAAEQGVSITPVVPAAPEDRFTNALPKPFKVAAGLASDLLAAAKMTAAFLASGLAAAAAREAMRVWSPGATGREVASHVTSQLEDLSDATLRTEFGGAIWAAENEGRFATLDQADEDGNGPAWLEASEVRDGNTCEACAEIDGTRFDTVAEAQAEYPFGGYRDCDGRARCRGTIEPHWA